MSSEIDNVVVNGNEDCPVAGLNGVENVVSITNSANGTIEQSTSEVSAVDGPSTSAASVTSVPLPNYEDLFPALPGGGLGGPGSVGIGGGISGGPSSFAGPSSVAGGGAFSSGVRYAYAHSGARSGNTAPKLRSSNISQIYRVAPEERRSLPRARFGEQSELQKICSDIMSKTATDIQLTSSKDGTLTFLITGKEESTNQARRILSSEFQTQIVQHVSIPKEHHRIILGKGGKKLNDLEQSTGTKIQIPKQDDDSDSIRIAGTREAIEKAIYEMQSISTDAFSRHIERILIPKIYHPFIVGPFGRTLESISKETGTKVNVPPQSVQKDEITIIGEHSAVLRAKEAVEAIYNEKKRLCQTVSIEVKKPQHKYIVGPKGHTLNEIFEITGVSVEMPSPDSTLETIILRGEPDKLANALAVLYQKAHSETEDELPVPGWIQRHILGPKGSKFQELSAEFPKVNVSFDFEVNKIKLSGPSADVRKAQELLKSRSDEIASQFAIEEIPITDVKHIRSIIGKNGSNLKQIREETKATVQIVGDNDFASSEGGSSGGNNRNNNKREQQHQSSNSAASGPSSQYIRIEGTRESVAKAKAELQSLLKKLESEVQFELVIERRFYGEIIGPKGANIRDIRAKFNQVQINFPEANLTSEKVLIRGEKKDAEECFKYLSQLNKELLVNNFRLEVPILKQLVPFLHGKDSIKNIREEFGTRIDLLSNDTSDIITITGPRDKVDKVRDRIQKLQSTLGDMSSVDLMIPAKIHNYMLGAKGRNIKQIMSECGGVLVNFPSEGSGSDKVNVRGPKDCVTKAKAKLLAMSNDYLTNNYSETLKVRVEHHSYLIGKNGSRIRDLRDQTGVRVYFASENPVGASSASNNGKNLDQDIVTITGKKESVQRAKAILEEKIKELEQITEDEIRIEPRFHHLFVSRRAAVCKQLFDEYGGVNISFPPQSHKDNDRIVLKGSKECVEAVKHRILEIVSDFEAQVAIEVEIDSVHHRSLLGRGRVNLIQGEYDVRIKFPLRPQKTENDGESKPTDADSNPSVDGGDATNRLQNIVTITGRKENCEKARDALLLLVPISDTVSIPFEFHRFVIGQRGAGVRELMDRCNVNVRVPPPADKSDLITITGTVDCVAKAKKELSEKLKDYEAEKSKNFALTFTVDPQYHRKIIGKGGQVIMNIRQKFAVQINIPESGKGAAAAASDSGNAINDQITIVGLEANTLNARDAILKIVKDIEESVTEELDIDSSIHPRLIGSRGKNIIRIMDQYKVDIRFPRSSQNGEANPNLVTISGPPEAVAEAREYLLETADSYLDDIEGQYQPPKNHQFQINFEELSATAVVKESNKGFAVRGGPWEKKNSNKSNNNTASGGVHGGPGQGNANHSSLDTNSAQDFPAFGGGPGSVSSNAAANAAATINGNGIEESITLNGGIAWGPKKN